MDGSKLYSKKEIQALLQKATELQKNDVGPVEDGLTLEELEQIATDSGIDPMYLREAISGRSSGSTEKTGFHLLGAPLSLEVGKEVPFEMNTDDWELVVQQARKTFNKSGGTIQHLGKSLEWVSPDHKFIHASLTATPSKDKTRFFVSSHYGKVAFLSYYFPFVLSVIAMGIVLGNTAISPLTGTAIILAGITTALGSSRYFFNKWVKFRKKKMEDMISRFEQIISVNDIKSISTQSKEAARINIPDDDIEETNIEFPGRNKTRS